MSAAGGRWSSVTPATHTLEPPVSYRLAGEQPNSADRALLGHGPCPRPMKTVPYVAFRRLSATLSGAVKRDA